LAKSTAKEIAEVLKKRFQEQDGSIEESDVRLIQARTPVADLVDITFTETLANSVDASKR
jgi:hypothetical protein